MGLAAPPVVPPGFIGGVLFVARPFRSRTTHAESALAPGRSRVSWTEYGARRIFRSNIGASGLAVPEIGKADDEPRRAVERREGRRADDRDDCARRARDRRFPNRPAA